MSTTQPEALRENYTAADMATAAAQGFRDGVASLSLPAAGQEPVAWQGAHDPTDLYYRKPPQADVHPLYRAAPQPAVAAGWVSVDDRLPEPDEPVLAHNGKWTGVAAWMSGEYLEPLERWQDEHREFIEMMGPAITHWMPLPPAPSTEGE